MDLFCHKLPKIELHAHLNGSLSKLTLKQLGCLENSISQYQSVKAIGLKDAFALFKVAHEATSNTKNLYIATQNVIEEFAKDNVVYLELRTTPRSEEGMSEDDYIETVIKAIRENRFDGILVKLILSLDRRRSREEQTETLDRIIRFKNSFPDLIRGVDLSGDPAKGDFFRDIFEKARENGLKTAIHCAEIQNDAEVKNILEFKPDRLGHGTFIHTNPELWALYKQLNIPVECCLTSNVICLTANSYAEHHVQEWIKEKLPFCLATDDKGVFNTSLSEEFLHIHKASKLNELELWTISYKSIEYSFASAEEKNFLRFSLEKWKIKNIKDNE
ncbi:unnamed protein product [Ceutorhynchus assimilis]|uniref:Adenosine deaminase domain-containing protein n=1 Tax=Ceutorhynchus assimilis TaxID=467358 RepID=A0A9N9MHM0_9CUCU|nr:unnamed protein product [Ceutorhynchus assimilis]